MTGPARRDQLSDTDFITLWNAAASIDEVVERIVVRVGRVPRWAVMARAVVLRRSSLQAFGPLADPVPGTHGVCRYQGSTRHGREAMVLPHHHD
jgi:hypothetical protein